MEHGFRDRGGTVTLIAERSGAELRTTIRDDGSGLPEEFRAGQSGLGTQIVQALVSGEMRGRITWEQRPEGGTDVIVEVTLRPAMASVSPDELAEA